MHHSTKGHSKGDQQHNKYHLRQEKDCLNCGHIIESRFCSYCGQENTEKRQSFGHLITHFIEDLTHYEGSFWKTIRYLLFRPALLTKAYLAGKRASFVAPVKLYIFVSFLCFFLPGILPDGSHAIESPKAASHTPPEAVRQDTATSHEFKTKLYWENFSYENYEFTFDKPHDYTSVAQLDSIQQTLASSQRYNWLEYRIAKKIIYIYDHYSNEEISDKFENSFEHNIPKTLFVYMPFFALLLWAFHGKKRWFYFDHAIFTLHYFSFMLLASTMINILDSLFSFIHLGWVDNFEGIYTFILIGWMFFYFFRAHFKMYGESWLISVIKSLIMLVINMIFMLLLLIIFGNITLLTLH